MADEGGERSVFAAGVEESFETAGGAAEVVDGSDVRGVLRTYGECHRIQFIGCCDAVCWVSWRLIRLR